MAMNALQEEVDLIRSKSLRLPPLLCALQAQFYSLLLSCCPTVPQVAAGSKGAAACSGSHGLGGRPKEGC